MRATRWFTRSVSKAVLLASFIGVAACSSNGGGTASPTLTSVQVTPASEQIPVGITQQYAARGSYSDGSTRDLTAQVTWASTTPATASISAAGLATAAHEGSTTITATLAGVSGSTPLAVTAASLRSITVAPASTSIAVSTTQQFVATGHFSNGDAQDLTQQATWTSSTPATATVTAGLARAVAAGSTTISASLGGITGTATLSVTSHTLQSIQVTPASPQVPAGLTVTLAATGTFSDGTTQDLTAQAAWTSSASAIATVAATGVVTGVAVGSATITATFSGVSGSTPVTVDASVLRSIVVTPVDQPVTVGGTVRLTATGQFSDGDSHDVTAQASWTANPAALVSIAAPGLVKGVAAGTVQVAATVSGVSGGTNVTVGSSPAIPDPPPDVAGYFQIMIDNRITSSVTPYFLVTANQMSLTAPPIISPTFLTGGGPNFKDWTAPVFQILDTTTGQFASGATYPSDGSFTLDMLPLDPSGQYRILRIPFLNPADSTQSLGGSGHLTITLGAPTQTSIVQSQVTKLYAFALPTWDPTQDQVGGQQPWDFVEFNCATPSQNGTPVCVINTTNVDFFFLGITVKARQPGVPYTSFGLDVGVPDAMASMLAALDALPPDYKAGKVKSSSTGSFLRYLSPGHSFTSTTTDLDAQITSSWAHYASTPLQFWVTGTPCTATNVGGVLQFTQPETFSVTMPTTLEAVTATGPLDTGPLDTATGNCVKFIAAYLNRGVFQDTSTWYTTSAYYPPGGNWNQYAALLHSRFIQNLAYGFSYDDVPSVPQTNPAVNNATSTTLVLSDH